MGLETATYIEDLDPNWPLGGDNVSQGDDHIRTIKSVLQNQFPNLGDEAVTKTAEELNESNIPAGSMVLYGGTNTPTGYLKCHGQEANRNTYPALFSAIGTNYGAGNGTTTFNLPDMRNRVPGGVSSLHLIGAKAGKDTWTSQDLPDHDHEIEIDQGGQHSHRMETSSFQNTSGDDRVVDSQKDNEDEIVTELSGLHTHDASISANEGAGQSTDNRQATLYFNYLIKT